MVNRAFATSARSVEAALAIGALLSGSCAGVGHNAEPIATDAPIAAGETVYAVRPEHIRDVDIVAPGYRMSAFRFDPADAFHVVFDRRDPEPPETCVGGEGLARVLEALSQLTAVRSWYVDERWPAAQDRATIRIRTFSGHEETTEYEVADPPGITDRVVVLWPLREDRWERTLVSLAADAGAEVRGGCALLGGASRDVPETQGAL